MTGWLGLILKRLKAITAAPGIKIPSKTQKALKPSELSFCQRARLAGPDKKKAVTAQAAGIKSEKTA